MPSLRAIDAALSDRSREDIAAEEDAIYKIPLSERLGRKPSTFSTTSGGKGLDLSAPDLKKSLSGIKDTLSKYVPSPDTLASGMFANPQTVLDYLSGQKSATKAALPIAGNIGSLLMPFMPKAGEPMMQAAGKLAGRIGYGAGTGAAMSEEPENIAKAGIFSAATEAVPVGLRAAGSIAQSIVPKAFTEKLSGHIKDIGDKIYANIQKYYKPVFKKLGHEEMPLLNIHNAFEEHKDYLSPNAKLAYKKFYSDPTVQNGHVLFKQLGQDIGKLGPDIETRAINEHKIQGTRNVREAVLDEMQSTIDKLDPKSGNLFKKGRKLYRDYYALFKEGNVMKNIREGNIEDINPKQLQKALKDLKLGSRKKPHPLQKMLPELSSKIQTGEAIGALLSSGLGATVGSLAGSAIMPGGGGLTGGFAGGIGSPLLGYHLGHPLVKLGQNKKIIEFFKNLEKAYRVGTRKATPTAVGLENQ